MCVEHLTPSELHDKNDLILKPQAKSVFSGQNVTIEAHGTWSNGFLFKMSTTVLLILGPHDRCRWFHFNRPRIRRNLLDSWLTIGPDLLIKPTMSWQSAQPHHPWEEEKRPMHMPLQNVSNYLHYWIRLKREHMIYNLIRSAQTHPTASGNRALPIPNLCWVLSLPAPWKLFVLHRRKIAALFSQVGFPSTSWRVTEHESYPSMSRNIRDVWDTDTSRKTGNVALWRTIVVANVYIVSCLYMPDTLQTLRGLLKHQNQLLYSQVHKAGAGPPRASRVARIGVDGKYQVHDIPGNHVWPSFETTRAIITMCRFRFRQSSNKPSSNFIFSWYSGSELELIYSPIFNRFRSPRWSLNTLQKSTKAAQTRSQFFSYIFTILPPSQHTLSPNSIHRQNVLQIFLCRRRLNHLGWFLLLRTSGSS